MGRFRRNTDDVFVLISDSIMLHTLSLDRLFYSGKRSIYAQSEYLTLEGRLV